jgi:hypothetical protein
MKTRWMMLSILLAACDAKGTVEQNPPVKEPVFDDTFTHANPEAKGPAVLTATDESVKAARRVSIDQLRNSIPELFGGITWTMQVGRLEGSAFNLLSKTLGEPDYIAVTTENRDPSPLFAKYMDDMAGDVCAKAIEADKASTGQKLVMVESDVDQNIRFLRLKLHGIWVPDGSTEGLGELRKLYDDILGETNDASAAWFGVCVAMLTAPETMAY